MESRKETATSSLSGRRMAIFTIMQWSTSREKDRNTDYV